MDLDGVKGILSGARGPYHARPSVMVTGLARTDSGGLTDLLPRGEAEPERMRVPELAVPEPERHGFAYPSINASQQKENILMYLFFW